MAYQRKKGSEIITKIKPRLTAMKTIEKNKGKAINYGGEERPLTVETVTAQIAKIEGLIEEYNGALDKADDFNNKIEDEEKVLAEMSAGVLSGAKTDLGRNSSEVEMLGGTRLDDIGKDKKKADPKPPTP